MFYLMVIRIYSGDIHCINVEMRKGIFLQKLVLIRAGDSKDTSLNKGVRSNHIMNTPPSGARVREGEEKEVKERLSLDVYKGEIEDSFKGIAWHSP